MIPRKSLGNHKMRRVTILLALLLPLLVLAGCLRNLQILSTETKISVAYSPLPSPTPTPYQSPSADDCSLYRGEQFRPLFLTPPESSESLLRWVKDYWHSDPEVRDFGETPSYSMSDFLKVLKWTDDGGRVYQIVEDSGRIEIA